MWSGIQSEPKFMSSADNCIDFQVEKVTSSCAQCSLADGSRLSASLEVGELIPAWTNESSLESSANV
jgi:hypothetical protein